MAACTSWVMISTSCSTILGLFSSPSHILASIWYAFQPPDLSIRCRMPPSPEFCRQPGGFDDLIWQGWPDSSRSQGQTLVSVMLPAVYRGRNIVSHPCPDTRHLVATMQLPIPARRHIPPPGLPNTDPVRYFMRKNPDNPRCLYCMRLISHHRSQVHSKWFFIFPSFESPWSAHRRQSFFPDPAPVFCSLHLRQGAAGRLPWLGRP